MIEDWVEEVKAKALPDELGMILVHNGIVRGTSKGGKPVQGMTLSYDEGLLSETVSTFKTAEGIVDIKVWINNGKLAIGDDIMFVLVAGRFRTDVLPVFEQLLRKIKNEIVNEEEA
jgi:molybdopterin synthase catalytic subunit